MASRDSVIVVVPSDREYRLIEDWLFAEGIEALPASCLLQAVLQQVTTPASVILYDTDAPESWQEALEHFLYLRPTSRVVLLSRLADEEMWMQVLDCGGYDLLMKPSRAREICAVVRDALRRCSGSAAA